jgi:hypothetical protein
VVSFPWGSEPKEDDINKFFDSNIASDYTGPADGSKSKDRFLKWFMGRVEGVVGSDGYAVGGKMSLAVVMIFNMFANNLSEGETLGELPGHRRECFWKQNTYRCSAGCTPQAESHR